MAFHSGHRSYDRFRLCRIAAPQLSSSFLALLSSYGFPNPFEFKTFGAPRGLLGGGAAPCEFSPPNFAPRGGPPLVGPLINGGCPRGRPQEGAPFCPLIWGFVTPGRGRGKGKGAFPRGGGRAPPHKRTPGGDASAHPQRGGPREKNPC